MKFKKITYLMVTVMAMMFIASCGKKKEPEVVEVTPKPTEVVSELGEIPTSIPTPIPTVGPPEGKVVSYLTGEYVSEEIGRRRPIAVMMNNIQVAVPQAGIANAGVIYEAPVEGGITRLMAVIEDYDNLEKIGSMRSCRNYYIFYASGFNAIYVHYGQSIYAEAVLELPEVNNLSGLAGYGEEVFYRTSNRQPPHNAYTSYKGIQKGIEICGYSQDYRDNYEGSYVFAKEGENVELPGEWEASIVKPGYSINDARFEYNEDDGLYYRFQYGDKQVDELTNEQLKFKNILLQYSSWRDFDENGYLDIDVDTPNRGVYITNGKAIEVTWEKREPWGATYYYDKDGKQITMNQGKTWVCIIQDTYEDRVEIGEGNPETGTDVPQADTEDKPDAIAPEAVDMDLESVE